MPTAPARCDAWACPPAARVPGSSRSSRPAVDLSGLQWQPGPKGESLSRTGLSARSPGLRRRAIGRPFLTAFARIAEQRSGLVACRRIVPPIGGMEVDQIPEEPPAPAATGDAPRPRARRPALRASQPRRVDRCCPADQRVLIFSLTVGQIRTESGTERVFNAYLGPAWFLVYLAMVLAYAHIVRGGRVAERRQATDRLAGRAGRWESSRSVAAIAGRTLLRLVDWLPVLYLVGFLAMLRHWRGPAPAAGRSCGQDEGDPGATGAPSRPGPWCRWLWLRPCWR